MAQPGDVVAGKYELVRLLGEGRRGQVYEARTVTGAQPVCVKLLRQDAVVDAEALGRFYGSERVALALNQAGVRPVTACETRPDGPPALVMPLLEGQSLAALLAASEGPVFFARAIDIVFQVMSALQSLHEAGLAHGNLKPSNVFLVPRQDRKDEVKLLDVEPPDALAPLRATVADVEYLSPEQAAGAVAAGPLGDLHAVGVLLYELLTGAHPYRAGSVEETLERLRVAEVVPPTTHRPGVSQNVERVILKAMARDADDRYSSARMLKHALVKQAQRSGKFVPDYITAVTFTGQLPVLDPTDLDEETSTRTGIGKPIVPTHRRAWTAAIVSAVLAALIIAVVLLTRG